MQFQRDPARLAWRGSLGWHAKHWLTKALAIAATVIVLLSALAVSVVLLAVGMTALLAFGGYVWWKTRHVRRELRRQFERPEVIEGVVIHVDERAPADLDHRPQRGR